MSLMADLSNKKRVRDYSDESEVDSPEVKRLREDLLENSDDSDISSTCQDLESFMKSFEEEISYPSFPATVVDLTSDSGESQPNLGYLLEASDDELGLPPSTVSSDDAGSSEVMELVRVSTDLAELIEFGALEDQNLSYDSFCFSDFETEGYRYGNGEYVEVGGLFDHSDLGYGSSGSLRRPENFPAQ